MQPASDTAEHLEYIGNELELFESAVNWKRYLASRLADFVKGDVLEVGAGLGTNVPYFHRQDLASWVSLEPDETLCDEFRGRQSRGVIPPACELIRGTIESLPAASRFDSILYIDVLEHIEDDQQEFDRAFCRLKAGGHLLVLCPAHNFLYSPFDRSIGHFRRYNRQMFRKLSDRRPLRLEYLDSVGMLASVANRLFLKQSYPGEKQIRLWDSLFVRLSTVVDPVTFRQVGKSILGVWKSDPG